MFAEALNAVGGGLDKLMNLVPVSGKLTIIPFTGESASFRPAGPPFVAMFNPEQWHSSVQVQYCAAQPDGTTPPPVKFKYMPPENPSFELLFDGTGASGEKKREVSSLILALRTTVGFNGSAHEANKLLVIWGHFIFRGRLTKMDTTYTLFRPDGSPLRAKVKLDFIHDTDPVLQVLEMNLQSADLTHFRTIKENERLDQLCQAIYESPRHLLEVAAANGLTSFRTLRPGSELLFPPIEK